MRDTSPTNNRLQEALEWARESAKCQRCADYGYLIRDGELEDRPDTRTPCPDCRGTRYEYGHRQVDILIAAIKQRDEVMADMEQSQAHTLAFGLNEYQAAIQRAEELENRSRTWEAAALEMALAYIEAISLGVRRMTAVPTERERAAYRTVAALAAEKWRVSYPPRAQETSCPAE